VDLENVIQFLVGNLPSDIVQPLSNALMPTLSDRLLNIWLHSAVPSSLDEMEDYQKALTQVGNFATALEILKWPGVEGLHDWVSHAPRIWLNKRRETALESTRLQLSMGMLHLNL
jgi:centromere/kinetochore protein ZW10